MRPSLRVLVGAAVVAVSVAGCQQAAPPEATESSGRRSFADDDWDASAVGDDAPAAGRADADAQARDIEKGWAQAREATSDAERQRQAGEMLRRSRELADQKPPP
jgi:hypothetical protein